MLNEAALEAVRRGADQVEQVDVYDAVDRVLQVCWWRPLGSALGLLFKWCGRCLCGWVGGPSTTAPHSHPHTPTPVARQGIRRPSLPAHRASRRTMAVHEVGVALMAILLNRRHGRIEKVERVSAVPRGG